MMRLKVTALVLKKTKPTLSIKQKLKTTIELIWERVKICFALDVRPCIPVSPRIRTRNDPPKLILMMLMMMAAMMLTKRMMVVFIVFKVFVI